MKESNFTGMEVSSKTSGSTTTAPTTSLVAHSGIAVKRNMMKQSKLVHYLAKGDDTEKANLKT